MKMPEFLVFTRLFVIGFVGAEVCQLTFQLGTRFALTLSEWSVSARSLGVLGGLLICLAYMSQRGAFATAARMGRSYRVDLLVALVVGVWSNALSFPLLSGLRAKLEVVDPHWAPALLLMLCVVLVSPMVHQLLSRRKRAQSPLYFIADEEIDDETSDLLSSQKQAKSFAETVLASGAHQGIVFGVDGPWGVGKTSFINLAERYWRNAADRVIVCRFEPLRYSSDPDLTDRLIRDLTAAIQSNVYAPEFRPAASRYSRLIKGKADISFLGFKLSLEPSLETVDELLDDIDEVLRRIDRRVIIVVDDLDRLDHQTARNVLFATRRTFRLTQATYVLCYDTEVLAGGKGEGAPAREFLEKFVAVKLSLFVDSSSLRDFLRRDWERPESKLESVPSDTMIKLRAVLSELADILESDLAASYLPLVGDMRKVKRFVNAMLLMQIEKTDLGRTDFNKRDLINLMLLSLNYPGLFRRIYAEETDGRRGSFSVYRDPSTKGFTNAVSFALALEHQEPAARFLAKQLFDVETLGLETQASADESVLRSRACFNLRELRNLEGYLKLIVRFERPELQDTFMLYQSAVERVRKGASVSSLLTTAEFELSRGERTHDEFWRVLVSGSHDLPKSIVDEAIDTLVDYLPRYSAFEGDERGLRIRSIYTLLVLLDRAAWGEEKVRRRNNTPKVVAEIAWRVFGEGPFIDRGILARLASSDRGVLGWFDLMLFRLQCSPDRQGQLYNLQTALIVDQDESAETTGRVSSLARLAMRKLSQTIFSMFRKVYISEQRNFLLETNELPAAVFLGTAFARHEREASSDLTTADGESLIARRIAAARSMVKTFVIYQLSNAKPPEGAGVGCGYYDESGANDKAGIALAMNDYMFETCFNIDVDENNALLFLDYCLSHLSSSFFSDHEERGFVASRSELAGGLDPMRLGRFWRQFGGRIRLCAANVSQRRIVTANYIASYADDLDSVFAVLDELAAEQSI